MNVLDNSIIQVLISIALVAAGGAFTLSGYRFIHYFCGVIGFVLSAAAGLGIVSSTGGDAGTVLQVAGFIGGGIMGMLLNIALIYLDLFLIGVNVGTALGAALMFLVFGITIFQNPFHTPHIFDSSVLSGTVFFLFLIVPGLICGILALYFRNRLIIVLTSFLAPCSY